MERNFTLQRAQTALLLIDVQEKLFDRVERSEEILRAMRTVLQAFQILGIPLFVTEQYPQGLGHTIAELKQMLPANQQIWSKTSFSCIGDGAAKEALLNSSARQWVLMGIEAHVCVLQTAKELQRQGREVVVLNDAISSRSIYDFSTAIAEMRDCGIRISSAETILFELLGDAKAAEFKQISALIKPRYSFNA